MNRSYETVHFIERRNKDEDPSYIKGETQRKTQRKAKGLYFWEQA